jgi:hypothetical protein
MARMVRRLSVVVVAVLVVFLDVPGASADFHGAFKFGGSSFPTECLYAGSDILTTPQPNKHNVEGVNACQDDEQVGATLWHYDSNGRIVDVCNGNMSTATNYYQCGLQKSTLSGDYWEWEVTITGGAMTCTNRNSNYQDCFS